MSASGSARPIAVVGAGTLGRRIALMFATQGGVVRICDLSAEQRAAAEGFIDKQLPRLLPTVADGVAADVEFGADLAAAVTDAWLVVESLPERLELKREVFAELDRLTALDAILASNSSSYPTSKLVDAVTAPHRVLNMHFFMPPYVTAVELMSSGHTDPSIIERLMGVLPRFGLTPFEARRESVGFIYNRIWAAIKRESLAVAAEGVATPQEIDRLFAMVLGTESGPFRMMDRVGLDIALDIENHYAAERPGLPESPRRLLEQYIADGRLGIKSGRGFYDDYRRKDN
jgi:3-hydroxybutyryl-CoA dehydrogenase